MTAHIYQATLDDSVLTIQVMTDGQGSVETTVALPGPLPEERAIIWARAQIAADLAIRGGEAHISIRDIRPGANGAFHISHVPVVPEAAPAQPVAPVAASQPVAPEAAPPQPAVTAEDVTVTAEEVGPLPAEDFPPNRAGLPQQDEVEEVPAAFAPTPEQEAEQQREQDAASAQQQRDAYAQAVQEAKERKAADLNRESQDESLAAMPLGSGEQPATSGHERAVPVQEPQEETAATRAARRAAATSKKREKKAKTPMTPKAARPATPAKVKAAKKAKRPRRVKEKGPKGRRAEVAALTEAGTRAQDDFADQFGWLPLRPQIPRPTGEPLVPEQKQKPNPLTGKTVRSIPKWVWAVIALVLVLCVGTRFIGGEKQAYAAVCVDERSATRLADATCAAEDRPTYQRWLYATPGSDLPAVGQGYTYPADGLTLEQPDKDNASVTYGFAGEGGVVGERGSPA